jgi:hypothetical protein
MYQKLTEVERTHGFESSLRKKQISSNFCNTPTAKKAAERFYNNGSLSTEIFAKSEKEKRYLKAMKKSVDNERFVKIMAKLATNSQSQPVALKKPGQPLGEKV